jgi:hypothetical protein
MCAFATELFGRFRTCHCCPEEQATERAINRLARRISRLTGVKPVNFLRTVNWSALGSARSQISTVLDKNVIVVAF